MRFTLVVTSLVSVVSLVGSAPGWRHPAAERALLNDNRTPAGTLRGDVLTIHLEARDGDWHPDGDARPGVSVRAFGEVGGRPSIPGPLIRVPLGTEIHASMTNHLSHTLVVRGLVRRGGLLSPDTIQVAPGATRELRYAADAVGTYYYSGQAPAMPGGLESEDAELSGALIVDPRGAPPANDRVFLIALWTRDGLPGGIINRGAVIRFTINGRSWPNTERLSYDVGDTVRFRIINASGAPHPMHLHGFYFKVDSRGDGTTDSIYAAAAAPYRVVTERATTGRTFTMTWVPERAGNWLFHCHDNFHTLRNAAFDGTPLPPEQHVHVTNHATGMMAGLVMGISVRGRDVSRARVAGEVRRALRLVAQPDAGGTDSEPAYGYVLHEGDRITPPSGPLLPGPTLVLKRGQPVTITVVNHLREPTAVHWHGIELESYFDGVADFAGSGSHIAHAIAPGDSFQARFTPPRSGTFMYHPHADEIRQQTAGMSGTLLVVDDPTAFDPAHDIVLMVTVPRLDADGDKVLVNGSLTPPPIEMRVGERYRLRLVDVHTYRPSMIMRLRGDSALVSWRALAKDGMDIPPERATVRAAAQQMGNGETYDFEVIPTAAGDLRFTVSAAAGQLLATVPVRVR
jgi:manganese oxidase